MTQSVETISQPMVTVLFIFDSQFVGRQEVTTVVPRNTTELYIKKKFHDVMGVEFDENCSYEFIENTCGG